jgi:hypothetical protein
MMNVIRAGDGAGTYTGRLSGLLYIFTCFKPMGTPDLDKHVPSSSMHRPCKDEVYRRTAQQSVVGMR